MRHRPLFVTLLCFIPLSIVALLLAPAQPAYAAPVRGDEVVLGDDLTMQEGEHVDGDLVVIGGNLTMRAGSRVQGSVTALGGKVEVHGSIVGDLVVFGGDVNLGAQARVDGDTIALGGRLHREPGAQIANVVAGPEIRDIKVLRDLRLPFSFTAFDSRPGSLVGAVVSTLVGAGLTALLGLGVVRFWPAQTAQVGETLLTAPLPSLGIGCLAYPLAASLSFFVLITICMAPFVPVVVLLVVAASLFGWIALGRLFGLWLARRTGWRHATPLAVTGAGVFALTAISAIVGAIPCLGFALTLGAASIGLGAVVLSRFGTTPYKKRPSSGSP